MLSKPTLKAAGNLRIALFGGQYKKLWSGTAAHQRPQEGAQATGEAVPVFIARTVLETMERDKKKGGEPQ